MTSLLNYIELSESQCLPGLRALAHSNRKNRHGESGVEGRGRSCEESRRGKKMSSPCAENIHLLKLTPSTVSHVHAP